MRTYKNNLHAISSIKFLLAIVLTSFCIYACNTDNKETSNESVEIKKENVVEIITQNMDFQMPDTIPSGWNTFRYINQSPQTHFFTIEKYPEGKTMENVRTMVLPYFDSGMKLINEGKSEEGFAEFGKLPKWFSEVIILGGMALVSPGNTAETMIRLEPGHYFIECYVKMSNGVFHSSVGMFREFDVSDNDSGNEELMADYNINISSTEGIVFDDNIKAGTRTFSVFFKDQIVHENFAGHDINLAKIDETVDLVRLEQWMNWADPKGLIEPAPIGVNFIGGVNNMPAGGKGYFTVNLEPGNYVLISEVPNALSKNMLKTFEVLD
jgi:hypothetical protein